MFLMQKMEDKDAIRIDNLIQYSKYSGYALKFKYEGNAINNNDKLIKHNIIAIDAVCDFTGGLDKESIERDLIKAYVGFNLINFDDENIIKLKKTIATGNWGCGAFGGDFELKFLQQWLAATFAGVDKLYYYSFKSPKMEYTIQNLEKLKLINAYNLYLIMMNKTLEKGTVLETIMQKCDNEKSIKQIKKLGPLENILKMLPGARNMGLNNVNINPKDMAHIEAIILSMTPEERKNPDILKATRKQRIAKGSGRSVEEVNRLLKQFEQGKMLMKQFGGNGKMRRFR